MSQTAMFFIAQSLIIIGFIVGTYVKMKIELAIVKNNTEILQNDHAGLSKKVEGISRAVSRLEGKVEA